MATESVHVSATSNKMIFAGNMYKAPPLDKKRRKKWHERYFILRANRTLECYKSLKAAESNKSPRRIIDLRECISLEIGLEYRNYEHILSLGTFKRTFFLAAPSDPLMLQWANVLEKTKSAQDGESIEVLDIGLRKTMHAVPVVHRVKPDSPAHRFSVESPKRNLHHALEGNGVKSVGYFARDSNEMANHRSSDVQEGRSHNWIEDDVTRAATSFETPNKTEESISNTRDSRSRSKSPHRVPLKLKHQLSSDSQTSQSTSTTSQTDSLYSDRPTSLSSQQSFNVSPSHVPLPGHMTSSATPFSHVPPPSGIIRPASRTKDGFFVPYRKSGGEGEVNESQVPSSKETSPKLKAKGINRREFVVKDGALQRSKPGRNVMRNPNIKVNNNKKLDQQQAGPNRSNALAVYPTHSDLSTATNYQSNMKRSFRYRMITLRAEKPIFVDNNEDNSDSDDEDEQTSPGVNKTRHKLPITPIPAPRLNKIPNPTTVKQENHERPPISSNANQRGILEPNNTTAFGQPRANGYSKLKVIRVKPQPIALPDHISAKLNAKPQRQRSSSQSDTLLPPKVQPAHKVTSLSQDDILLDSGVNDNAAAAQMLTGISLEEHEADVFDILPARPPSNGFMYSSMTSLNSLDDILVAPPPMFSGESVTQDGTELETSEIESEIVSTSMSLSKQLQDSTTAMKKPVPKARSRQANNNPAVRQFHVGHMTIEPSHVTSTTIHVNSKPLQQLPKVMDDSINPSLIDRNSTESNDTGYTSGASPGFVVEDKNSASNFSMQEFKLQFSDELDTTAQTDGPATTSTSTAGLPNREKGKSSSDKHLNFQLSQTSVTSTASDFVRFYVPVIFYKPGSKAGKFIRSSPTNGGSSWFSLEVCLVEDSDELIKDLVSVKSLEGFAVVECDEIEGSSNVSTLGDDFTVETALEDLEFGFTVIQSTQQDMFMRKVRQFHFDIQRLFGSSKPFSCDVVIRHTDQITVLPIEVEMKS